MVVTADMPREGKEEKESGEGGETERNIERRATSIEKNGSRTPIPKRGKHSHPSSHTRPHFGSATSFMHRVPSARS